MKQNTLGSKRFLRFFLAGALVCVSAILVWVAFPHLPHLWQALRDPTLLGRFIGWIDSIGFAGIPALLLFQMMQIVVAFLPGGLVELASGMLYGPLLGFSIALCGILLGTVCAFWISRRFGEPLVRRLVNGAHFDRYTRLCQSQRFRTAALLFFLLPGVPKDILIYVIGCSGVLTRRFVLYATLARIPSVAVSSFAGSIVREGKFGLFAVVYLCFLTVGGIGALIHRRVLHRLEHHGES